MYTYDKGSKYFTKNFYTSSDCTVALPDRKTQMTSSDENCKTYPDQSNGIESFKLVISYEQTTNPKPCMLK